MRHLPRFARRTGTAAALALVAATLSAGPAHAATLDMKIAVVSDGNTFTPDLPQQPGADQGPSNGIVRTNDAITYRVDVNALQGAARHETFVLRAPEHTAWSALPPACLAAGSSITPSVLTCDLGTLEGHTAAVAVALDVTGDAANGETVAVSGTVHSDEQPTPTAPVDSTPVQVSASPRYDLAKNLVGNLWNSDATGPGGTKGISITYPVTVAWRPVVEGQGIIGVEKLTGDVSFDDDVSRMSGGRSSSARLLTNSPRGACGPNDGVFPTLPGSSGGGHQNVVDSGAITCTQASPGAPVHVEVKGLDTSLASRPDQGVNGKPIEAGPAAYVAQFFISLWIPYPAAGTPIESVNSFTPLEATSISGQPNYPGAGEPLANNSSHRTISLAASGGGYKVYGRVLADGSVVQDDGKKGDPWVTPGTVVRSQVNMRNDAVLPATGAIACDVFDNTVQTIARGSAKDPVFARSDAPSGSHVEFAAHPWSTPQEARDATCGAADGPWFDSPDDVPGGAAAVGAVRIKSDVPGSGQRNLFVYLKVREGADGNRIRNYGQLFFGTPAGWTHDRSSADIAAGGLSDFLLRTADLVRVTQVVVAPGTPVDSGNASLDTVLPGDDVEFQVFPSLSNATEGAAAQDVTVTDVLPAHTTYMRGSASVQPDTVDMLIDSDGVERQRLTWVFRGVEPDTAITPVTFHAQVVPGTRPGAIVNDVTVSSPGDVSTEALRHAARSVRVTSSGRAGVVKSAVAPVVVTGDLLRWSFTARDDGNTDLDDLDLIDVLPWKGDRISSFHGSVRLDSPVDVETGAGESARYTAADPSSISRLGGDPSNEPGGSTRWCSAEEFGSAGCPASLDAVTAVRILRSSSVPVGGSTTHAVALTTSGQRDGDVYANVVGLQSSSLKLPAESAPATVRVVAGSLGERVWWDANRDGLRQADEKPAGGVAVVLTGVDDRKAPVEASTRTDSAGRYSFDGLRPGTYSVAFTAPDGAAWTTQFVGDDRRIDSAVDAGGVARADLSTMLVDGALDGVQRVSTVNAGLVLQNDGGTPVDPDEPGHHGGGSAGGNGAGGGAGAGAGAGQAGNAEGSHAAGESGPGAVTQAGGRLAYTGAVLPVGVGAAGAALLLAGLVLLLVRRRRRRA